MQITVDPVSLRLAIVCILTVWVCDCFYRFARSQEWEEAWARLKALGIELTCRLKGGNHPPEE